MDLALGGKLRDRMRMDKYWAARKLRKALRRSSDTGLNQF
jgi:hypothetical protein